MAAGCSWTPRNSPPAVGSVNKGLQETSRCILTGLKTTADPKITNSVNIVESGKVQEIIGTSRRYQLYIIRLTAESDDTKVEVFNVLNGPENDPDFHVSKFQNALSPCVSGLERRHLSKGSSGSKRDFTGESDSVSEMGAGRTPGGLLGH